MDHLCHHRICFLHVVLFLILKRNIDKRRKVITSEEIR